MQQTISYESIVNHFNSHFFSRLQNDPLASVDEIFLEDYKKIRAEVNNAFNVGDCKPFAGEVAEETEFGDITDVLIDFAKNKFPLETASEEERRRALSVHERTTLRDELIEALDDMVPR